MNFSLNARGENCGKCASELFSDGENVTIARHSFSLSALLCLFYLGRCKMHFLWRCTSHRWGLNNVLVPDCEWLCGLWLITCFLWWNFLWTSNHHDCSKNYSVIAVTIVRQCQRLFYRTLNYFIHQSLKPTMRGFFSTENVYLSLYFFIGNHWRLLRVFSRHANFGTIWFNVSTMKGKNYVLKSIHLTVKGLIDYWIIRWPSCQSIFIQSKNTFRCCDQSLEPDRLNLSGWTAQF